jgi:hypothetical protein
MKDVQHFVPSTMGIFLGRDVFHHSTLNGELYNWAINYGIGSYTSLSKKGYEHILPNYNSISTNTREVWVGGNETIHEFTSIDSI